MDANAEKVFEFASEVVGGLFQRIYSGCRWQVFRKLPKSGILAGFPVLGIKATVYDGSYHEVDSSEMAFHIAGSLAFKDAMNKGGAVLLEPIMRVEVTTPEDYMGDVIGEYQFPSWTYRSMEDIGGGKMIKAFVPLAEMFGYATDLRSRTRSWKLLHVL
jgi:elongation factor G